MTFETKTGKLPSRTRAASALFLTQISAAVINLPVTILLARTLGPDSYGEYQLLNRIATITVSVVCFGYPHAIAWAATRSTSRTEDRSLVRFLLLASSLGGLACALTAIVLSELGIHPGEPTAWLVFGFFPLFNLLSANLINFFRGKLDASGIAVIKLTQAITWLLFCLCLVFTNQLSVVSAAAAMLGSQIISALAGVLKAFSKNLVLGRTEKLDLKGLTSFSARVFPGLAIRDLNVYLDQIVIALFLSTRDLGFYAVAVSLTTSLALLSGPVINTVQPIIQSAAEKERPAAIARAYAATVIVIGLPAVVLALVAPLLAPLIYGAEFSASIFLIQILCLASFLDALNSCAHGALLGLGVPGRSSWSSSIGLVTSLVLWMVFLPVWGTVGAATASVIAYLLVQVFMVRSLVVVMSMGSIAFVLMVFRSLPATFMAILRHTLTVVSRVLRRSSSSPNLKENDNEK